MKQIRELQLFKMNNLSGQFYIFCFVQLNVFINCYMWIFLRLETYTFWASMPHFGLKFLNINVRLQISTLKISYRQNSVKGLETWYFLAKNTLIAGFGLKFQKRKLVENFRFAQIWNLGSFGILFQFWWWGCFSWFWVILACSKF